MKTLNDKILEHSQNTGHDYPDTYREFVSIFSNDADCEEYLQRLRWPNGFICPSCKELSLPWRQTHQRLVCPNCRYQTSVCAGTIFEKTRTPLTVWFEAAWHLTTAKNGVSAKTLERTLGISYRVAWTMLQRLRVAMVRSERKLLSGTVEIDETLLGGAKRGGKRGRGADKCIVLIAVELKAPKGFGRVRLRYVPNASSDSLLPVISDMVKPRSVICTDGWKGYTGLTKLSYKHNVNVISTTEEAAHVSIPGVHRVASLLKRWIIGTHQGSFSEEHLQSYLEEFTFRFNRRTSLSRGLVFRRLLEQSVIVGPITEADVKHGYNWPNNNNEG